MLLLAQAEPWTILACYLPQGKGKPSEGIRPPKPPFFATMAALAAAHADKPLLVIGDLNNGHGDHDRESTGANFVGAEDFEGLKDKGLIDLWRHGNPRAREYSWYSNTRDGGHNGFRIDHVLANEAWLRRTLTTCEYDHSTRTGVTNHSAIIVRCTPQ